MIVDPQTAPAGAMHRLMIGVIVPRPIAFVSTVGAQGRFNVAPFSFFNAISSRPPLVGIAINQRKGTPKDTVRNIRETGDFVVNVVDEALAERVVHASGDWPPEVDEFQLAELTSAPSLRVKSPRVAESPVSMECRLEREFELGQSTFVVGEILVVHVRDDVLSGDQVDPNKLKPVGRLGGDGYSVVRDVFNLSRPRIDRPSGAQRAPGSTDGR